MPLLPPIGQESATSQVQWVSVKNTSGAEIPGFGLMDATGVTTVDGKPVVQVTKTATTFRRFWYVNGPVPIPANKTGSATILAPQVWALYDSAEGTPAVGESWGAVPSSHKLGKNRPGFEILGGAASGRVLVVQRIVNLLRGTIAADVAKDSAATVTVHKALTSSSATAGWSTISAWNYFADIDSGAMVHAAWINGGWELSAAECLSSTPSDPSPSGGAEFGTVLGVESLGV